jgi:hypothetical protein
LHLDQQVLSDQVDHKPVDGDLDPVTGSGIPPFQRCVEWLFPEGPDMRCVLLHGNDPRNKSSNA